MLPRYPRRVAVTGVGCISPCGLDADSTFSALLEAKSGIAPIQGFDAAAFASRIAGECRGFAAEQYVEKKKLKEGDRFIHLALAASAQAIRSAGFEPNEEQRLRVATIIGVGLFGVGFVERATATLQEKGPGKLSPYVIPGMLANLAPGQVSMRYGFMGPSYATTSACASGAHAIADAARLIRLGEVDAAIAGGAEAAVTPLGVGGFTALRALSTRNGDPAGASRPFDADRDGFVIAEGAGMLMLEEFDSARRRGAPIVCELLGSGSTSDAYHLTQPSPDGSGAERAMREALANGGIDASQVNYVNAHGTSTGYGDRQEALALSRVVSKGCLISSTKSMMGHLLGAAGGVEAVICALALQRGTAPPTKNLDRVDPELAQLGLDFVPGTAREAALEVALSNSFGFGGTNASLLFGRV
jgi:3-oxoacyl-[acyl-carrier-protein] synthase II